MRFGVENDTEISTAKKLKGCAVTYRSGNKNMFGTCPADCELNPSGKGCDGGQIDFDYLDAVLDSKPRAGYSFTYTHFSPMHWAHKLSPIKTVLNYTNIVPKHVFFCVCVCVSAELLRCFASLSPPKAGFWRAVPPTEASGAGSWV